jgi:hypothetical protein
MQNLQSVKHKGIPHVDDSLQAHLNIYMDVNGNCLLGESMLVNTSFCMLPEIHMKPVTKKDDK